MTTQRSRRRVRTVRRRLGVLALSAAACACVPGTALAADPFGPLDAPQFQTSYSDEVLADSPVAYWRLGESSGAAMNDVTGTNNGTYIGGVTLGQPGALPYDTNTAVSFDGTAGRAVAPDSAALDRTGAVTVEAWVKRTKSAAYQVIVGKPGNGQSRLENYSIWFNSSNRAQAFFGNGTTFVSTTSAVVDTEWHHIAATYDNAVARIYIDGVQSGSASSTVALTPNDLGLNIGREYYNPYYFGGTLDEVAIYPTALSPERLQAHHAKAAADAAPPVVTLTQPVNGSSTSDATPSISGVAGTASGDASTVTVRLYPGAGTSGTALHTLTATPSGAGAYAVDAPALSDGTYTARAEQLDVAGNTGISGASTFTVDTAGPATTITSGPADPTSSTSASLEFGSEAGATFECKLDAGAYSPCTSPQALSGLTDGAHTFSVRATDTTGNAGAETTRTWTVDATGPGTTITGGPAGATSSTSASLEFSSEAGATFECKLDAGAYSPCTSPQSYDGLGEGSHVFAVRATDALGNTGTEAGRTWTIDASGPATSITSGPANPTNSSSASFEFGSEAGATFECKLDSGAYEGCSSPKAYSGLADGDHAFSVRATDTSGNTGVPATRGWSIDANGPDTTITGGPAGVTNSTSASLTFTSEAGAGFECKLDAGAYAPCTSPNALSGLTDGAHTFSVRATDTAGNTGAVATRGWSVDTVGPDATITGGPAGTTNSTSASLTFTAEAGASFECKLDAGAYAACTSPKAYSGLTTGSHTVSVRATDTAGNTGVAATHAWAVDTTAPVVGITTPPTGSVTTDRTPDVGGSAGTAAGDSSTISVSIFAGSTATGSPVQTLAATRAGNTYIVTAALLPTGVYTARAAQTDSAGNTGQSAATTFTINPATSDTTPPVISLTAPASGSSTNDSTPAFSGVAGIASGDSTSVRIRIHSGPSVLDPQVQTRTVTRNSSGSYSVSGSPALPDGIYTARAEQLDSGSNTGYSAARTFTIDTAAPVTTITGGPVSPTNSSSASFTFISDAGVSFQCRIGTATYTACTSPRTYTGVTTGTYTFSVRAIDAAGNTGTAATRSWTVDTTAPTATITGGPAAGSSTNSTAPSFAFTSEVGATFQCKLDAEAYEACTSPKAYTGLAPGSHTFSVRATDLAGNTGTAATRTWTIDTTAPTVAITGAPTDPTNSTSASLTFTSEAGATFACKLDAGSFAACTSPRAYTGLAAGSHTFTVRATDTAGNVSQDESRTWTIDNVAPVLTITAPPNGSSTNDTTPSLAGIAGSSIGDGDTVTVRVYTGTAATGTPVQTLSATRGAGAAYGVDATALAPGTYTARASQPDAAGNSGQSGTTTFTIDTTAPAVTLTSPANGSSGTDTTPTLAGVASSAAGDATSVTVRVYSGETATGSPVETLSSTRGGGGAYSVTAAELALGTYTARAEQTDAAGNSGLSSPTTFTITASATDPVLIGAGDIAGCGSSEGGAATAALIQQHPDATVFTLGDNAYPNGQPSQYSACYGSSWGAFKSRTRPITGGHDTETVSGGAAPNQGFTDYFSAQLAQFGSTATDRLKSYYSYDIGAWHVVMLNSSCYNDLPGCDVAQQEQWFRDDLAASNSVCTAVMWHDSRWSSGEIHGDEEFTQPLWQIAYEGGADIVLGGNEHHYERYAPQDANGAIDNQHGVRAFVVGTGGYYLYGPGASKPNSQVRSSTYGVMKLTLRSASYDWQFLPVAGETFTDSGTGSCHGKPPTPTGTPTVRSSASSTANHPSTALTVAKPAGTQSGDVMVASIAYQTGASRNIAAPSGWTAVPNTHHFDGGNAGIRAFYRVADGSEPASYTFNLTGGSGQAIGGGVMSLMGADTTNPIDASGGQVTSTAGITLTAPSITTTRPNTALIYSGAVNQPVTWAAPQLMPEQWDVDTSGAYNIGTSAAVGGVAAAGPTGTRSASILPSAPGVAISIAVASP